MENNNNKSKITYVIICVLCVICITITGIILLKLESANNSRIMRAEDPLEVTQQKIMININTATKSELMLLENIGAKKADDIIAYRESNPFKKPEDLMKVSGIGTKTFEKIKDFICVN